ncbi:MAG: TPM domain-containing protein [Clostridia bacterium]|nr:TPM domain-containing protein [Clostridia bacterium]
MKRIISLVICLLITASCTIWPSAADLPKVIDNADLLSSSEEGELSEKLDELSEELSCDIFIITEDSVLGSWERYAETFFEAGYGRGEDKDGILLLVDMGEREWHIMGSGICYLPSDSEAYDYICANLTDDLQDEDYLWCFENFAERSAEVIKTLRSGEEFKIPFDFGFCLIVSLIIGLVIAFIVTSVMKGQLNSVRAKAAAGDYLKRDSLELTDSSDIYLYRQVTRIKKVKTQSSGYGRSSSGSRSGKF